MTHDAALALQISQGTDSLRHTHHYAQPPLRLHLHGLIFEQRLSWHRHDCLAEQEYLPGTFLSRAVSWGRNP